MTGHLRACHASHRCRGRPVEGRARARTARAISRPLRRLGKRLGFAPVVWHELAESRAATATKRCAEEGAALLKLARDADAIIALDERGKALTSEAFAQLLGKIRDDGAGTLAILDRRPRRAGAGRARCGPRQARLRRHDPAARACPHRAGRAALSRRHHPRRASVSSGVKGSAPPWPPSIAADHQRRGRGAHGVGDVAVDLAGDVLAAEEVVVGGGEASGACCGRRSGKPARSSLAADVIDLGQILLRQSSDASTPRWQLAPLPIREYRS